MKTPWKLGAYATAMVLVSAGAFGVGTVTGSPIEMNEEHNTHGRDDSSGGTHSATPAGPAGLRVSESGYTLAPINAPGTTGKSGKLRLRVLGPDGTPVTEFTESHEKKLHLIVVRTDTTEFRHVHPTLGSDGTWSIDWQWQEAGTYRVFADFVPTALGDGLTLTRIVEVGGEYRPKPFPKSSTVAKVDDYTLTLDGSLVAGKGAPVTVRVERDGKPVTALQPYLGAYGHLVSLRDGDLGYLHVHPDGEAGDESGEGGPEVSFHVETPTAGSYRLFFDFQINDRVRTAEFTVSTDEAGDSPADEPDDEQGDDDDGHGGDGHGH
ncbi:MAG: hypothetical protein GEU86_15445 [Actinophytocola sp.]|nr:hypothetical protein [Actinophytocola sp.]